MIVNGKLNICGLEQAKEFCDRVIVRENTGYDAAAYKYVLCNCMEKSEVNSYDEIMVCNNSFYGPFKHLSEILYDMDSIECDFWGLNGYTNILWNHIQSYFMVFRKGIIDCFVKYLNDYVDYDLNNLANVVAQFEIGLFDFLTKTYNYKYAIYADNHTYDVYTFPLGAIKESNLQIIKRKSFYDRTTTESILIQTLDFVNKNYDYPVEIIKDEWNTIDTEVNKYINITIPSYEEVRDYVSQKEFYIYGNGFAAMNIYWLFAKDNIFFRGFIVSDAFFVQNQFIFGERVYSASEIGDNISVIISLSKTHRIEVLKQHKFDNYLCIY